MSEDVEALAEVIGAAYYDDPGPHFLNAARAVVVLLAAQNRYNASTTLTALDKAWQRVDHEAVTVADALEIITAVTRGDDS